MKRASRLPHWPPRFTGVPPRVGWRLVSKLLLALATAGILTALVFVHLDYYQIGPNLEQFRAGQPIPRDIIAPRPLMWEDIAETHHRRDEAASQVAPIFAFDPNAETHARADLDQAFRLFRTSPSNSTDDDTLVQLKIPQDVVLSARREQGETLGTLQLVAQRILHDVMGERIEEGRSERDANQRIDTLVAAQVSNPAHLRLVSATLRAVIRPTWIADDKRTEEKRRQARGAITPVLRRYQRGEVILQRGDTLTEDALRQFKDKQLLMPAPIVRLIPIAALMLFAVTALIVYLRNFCRAVYDNDRKLALLASLIIAAVWSTMTLGEGHESLVGLMAVPAGSMAIAGLLGVPVAIVSTVMISTAVGLTADHQFAMVILTLASSLAGMMAVSSIWPASRAVPAVLSLIAINLVLLVSLQAIPPNSGFPLSWDMLAKMTLWAGAGGIGATFIAVGAIYMLARPFGITTHYRLMELTNPNELLLRRMMVEAPGTYHSSVMVANMAESAADAIGANALLTRVAALYHDIGKLKRPAFFIENQAPLGIENIHQRLSPRLSYLILVSHVRDGGELARQYRLPDEITAVIREHHGTTLAAYFYHRALNEAGGNAVAEHEFRYPGPKPSTREAAVVMLSDSVQASVKALKEPTPGRIENMVHEIINSRLEDGQFEDCDITLRDIRRISEVFIRILTGLYTYSRIEYPEIKREGTRIRAHVNSETTSAASEPTIVTPGG